jgi:3-deoxy-7-phosphoheptulonate synthase
MVPAVREVSHLPVMVDPSHGTGRKSLIIPMSVAAVAAGCHGIMVEVHINPTQALSDAEQSLSPDEFRVLVRRVREFTRLRDRLAGG